MSLPGRVLLKNTDINAYEYTRIGLPTTTEDETIDMNDVTLDKRINSTDSKICFKSNYTILTIVKPKSLLFIYCKIQKLFGIVGCEES